MDRKCFPRCVDHGDVVQFIRASGRYHARGTRTGRGANGNQTTRVIGSDTFTLIYDAENRLVEVKKNSVSIAAFVYDGDGKRVVQTVNGVETYFIGNYYEKTGSVVTKYYYSGGQHVAMRKNGTVYYLFGDHLGSTSLTTNASGNLVSELRYKVWGEVRYSSGSEVTKYQYTVNIRTSCSSDFTSITPPDRRPTNGWATA